jgi:hypothetical protein
LHKINTRNAAEFSKLQPKLGSVPRKAKPMQVNKSLQPARCAANAIVPGGRKTGPLSYTRVPATAA